MVHHRFVFPLWLAIALGFAAVPAHAQIYTWRDGNGNLVLSNRPQAGVSVRTYAVPNAETVRVTRSLAISRGDPYDALIVEHARQNGVRPDLVRAVVQVESAFNTYARSPKGALGLMQLMPATIQQFGVRNPFNPVENVQAGVGYLRQLLDRYSNNEELALAAYNAGPGAVDKHGQQVPPFRETRRYVAQINQMAGHAVQGPGRTIYRTTEVIEGRLITHYSDRKPATGPYEIASR